MWKTAAGGEEAGEKREETEGRGQERLQQFKNTKESSFKKKERKI